MWRMTPRLAPAALTAALALAAPLAPEAAASAVQTFHYRTASANVGDLSGVGPIGLSGVAGPDAELTTPGSFKLGEFVAHPLPSTATLSYNHTPFTIDLVVASQPGAPYNPFAPSFDYKIQGELNGSITGSGPSDMLATITSITGGGNGPNDTPPFPIVDLRVNVPQGIAGPVGYNDGYSFLTAYVIPSGSPVPVPAPEPTSIAAFAAALAGWGLRRRMLRTRA